MFKYLSIVLLLSSFAFADYSAITSELCPSTPAGMEANLIDKKISNDYFNTCQGSDCDSLSVYYGEEITETVKVIEVNTDDIPPLPIINKFENLSSLTLAGQDIEVIDRRFESAKLECAYKNNLLVYAALFLEKSIDDSNTNVFAKLQNSKIINSAVITLEYSEVESFNFSKYSYTGDGSMELKYINNDSSIRIYSNDYKTSAYYEFGTSDLPNIHRESQSGPMILSITDEQVTNEYTFDFEYSKSCGLSEGDSCNEVIQSCFGPFDLKSDRDIIGDITLCNTGTKIRKNVLLADGSITKEPI